MWRLFVFIRLWQISWIAAKYGLDDVLSEIPYLYPLRFLQYLNPFRWGGRLQATRAERLHRAIIELGPVFIKFGQLLSTRRDLIPDEWAEHLAKLQDRVPPFSGVLAQQMLETEYGAPLSSLFLEFDVEPLAAASIAQVHAARLLDGSDVVVKILRPKVREIIRRDLRVLEFLVRAFARYSKIGRDLQVDALIEQYRNRLFDELDLVREAANASQLARQLIDSPDVKVPTVYWAYTKTSILVLERVYGIPIAKTEALIAAGVSLEELSKRVIDMFFYQLYECNFFHADLHPGNIFVDATDPLNPMLQLVDFGIMGSLDRADERYLAENYMAFLNRDYAEVARLHLASGWVPKGTSGMLFEDAIRSVCEPILSRPLKDISSGELLLRLFQTASRFKMPIQPQLFLLQKTLLNVEGLGRALYPDVDLWGHAKPQVESWLKRQMGPTSTLHRIFKQLPEWISKSPELPNLIYQALQHASMDHYTNISLTHTITDQRSTRRSRMMTILIPVLLGVFVGGGTVGAVELLYHALSGRLPVAAKPSV